MNAPLFDFEKLVQERTSENQNIYEAGHKEGYRLGFSEGIAEAKKIVEAMFGQIVKDKT